MFHKVASSGVLLAISATIVACELAMKSIGQLPFWSDLGQIYGAEWVSEALSITSRSGIRWKTSFDVLPSYKMPTVS